MRFNTTQPQRVRLDAAIPRAGIAVMVVLGAGLFWWLQPLGAEHLVVQHGGGAEVWTACLCFFQLALLIGYLYAHAIGRWCSPTVALGLHGGLVLVTAVLFRHPTQPLSDLGNEHLTWRIIAQLARDMGPAAVLLAATSPLSQLAHHHVTRHPPWRLYALANLVALLLLIIHPFVLEPSLPSALQGIVWRTLLACYGLAACVVGYSRLKHSPRVREELASTPPSRLSPWLWASLAAAASALLMATTEVLARDMASSPLLWVAPLAIFLGSIVFTFDRPHLYRPGLALTVMGLAMLATFAATILAESLPFTLTALAHLVLLAAGATLCHGELYRARPAPAELTRYHLSMALGGALGGVAVAVGAPSLFVRMVELPASVTLLCVTAAVAIRHQPEGRRLLRRAAMGLVIIACAGGAIGLASLNSAAPYDQTVTLRSRNAFGTLTLIRRQLPGTTKLMLVDGNTTHGEAHIAGAKVGTPTLYYAPETGIGGAFEALHRQRRPLHVGVIGMGVGTLAAYGRAGDHFTFYELNPDVVEIAQGHFTFLSESRAETTVLVGDGRARLKSTPPETLYDLLVIDAFSSDAIPTHLLTQEAMALYSARITDKGRIAFHVTNRHLDLVPVVEALAAHAGLGAQVHHTPGVATWVTLTAGAPPASLSAAPMLWTDDFAPVWRALK